MLRLALTLNSPAENIALDEALLDEAEAAGPQTEFLRIWESPTPLVVLGRSSRAADEVDLDACRTLGIPVLRRSSGGASIVAGPGCLMYAVVLSYVRRPKARGIHESHNYVLDRLADTLREQVPTVIKAGTSDLALCDDADRGAARKFSGNSLRVKRSHFLYHGTLLYDFELSLVAACLRTAPRQPEYRQARDHLSFIANLPLSIADVSAAIDAAWPTRGSLSELPHERLAGLLHDRYQSSEWGPL